MPAGINQEIKLVYCVKEFQQKSFQHLTMCKILKSQFGFLSYQQVMIVFVHNKTEKDFSLKGCA